MANPFFRFKKFTVYHDRCAMKVTTDGCFFGAWAAEAIRKGKPGTANLLDIGAGSGLLSLMVAQKNDLQIDAVEIDRNASEQAVENVEASPWKSRISIYPMDILSFQPDTFYDCIISNPPFYENELASGKIAKDTAHHSEQLTMTQVVQFIKAHLKQEGSFFLMYPYKRKAEMENLFRQKGLYLEESVTLHPSVNHAPFRMVVKGSHRYRDEPRSLSVPIWDEHREYSRVFADLLKEYYLYL